MNRKLLIAGTFASLAFTLPSWAAEHSGSGIAPVSHSLRGTVVCHGVQSVPVTTDAEQALPMHLVAQLRCGDEVAVLSDSEGYTAQIQTPDGKNGYVARIYLSEHSAEPADDIRPVEAVVENGIARWRAGAPGSDQFFTTNSLVESLTANGITVQVSLNDTGWKLRADVAIVNGGAEPVHFNPAAFTLDELKPRLRSLAYQNPRDLAEALTHQVYWTMTSATAPPSATYRNAVYQASGYVTPIPNYFVHKGQQDQGNALLETMLAPKEQSSGVVWFQRNKNARELNFRVFVGGQIFEFPFSFPQHN
ncbi:MAG: SH3 domain-containing protein [Candidatus Acidiferrum sp.]